MEQTAKPKKQRLFRWALWWGLGITVASIALLFIPGIDDGQDPVSDMMYRLLGIGFWPLLVVVGIVAPVMEELCFRLWGNGKRGTGIVSSVLMALFMWLTFNWYIGLISLAAGLAATLLVKERNSRLLVMMLLSSLLFMLAHTENYAGNVAATALALVEKFGFGLLASYLVINHNIVWSMVLHILNNSLACLAVYIGIASLVPTTFTEEGQHQVTLRPIILEKGHDISYWPTGDGDTITYNNDLDLIAVNLLETEMWSGHGTATDTVVVYNQSPLHVQYNVQIVFEPGKPHDYAAVVRTLERTGWLETDTTEEQAYMITVVDSTMRCDSARVDIWAGAYSFQRQGLPILQPEDFYYSAWPVTDYYNAHSIDEARTLLGKYGLGLVPCNRRMTMVRVKALHDPLSDL